MRASASAGLPASLILSSRQQKQYRRFLKQTTTNSTHKLSALPTAVEYAAFLTWCEKNDSGYFSDTPLGNIISSVQPNTQTGEVSARVGRLCEHALHPTQWYEFAEKVIDRCPACTVEIHTTYTNLLLRALEDTGTFMGQRWETAPPDNPLLEAFYMGKIALVHTISDMEDLADAEKTWNQQNPSRSQRLGKTVKTAEEALQLYWAGIEHSSSKPSPSTSPTSPPSQSEKQKTKRSITFDESTCFEPGRYHHYFWRKSPRYEPGGKYALSSPTSSLSAEDSDSDFESDSKIDCNSNMETNFVNERSPMRLGSSTVSQLKNNSGDEEIDAAEAEENMEELDSEDSDDDSDNDDDDDGDDSEDDNEDDSDDDDDSDDYEDSYIMFEETEETAFIEFGY
jgi:hypothetical protein